MTPPSPSVEAPISIAVIGCGRIAQVAHLPAIAKTAAARLAAVSDPSTALATGVGARYGVPAFTDTEDLLAIPDLDAVLIAVPDRYHLTVSTAALKRDLDVLVEKPAALTADEAEQLRATASATGRIVQIGAMRRHDPGMQAARTAVADLGRVLSAAFWYRLPGALRTTTEAALFPAQVVDPDVRVTEAGFKADRPAYLLRTHGAHVFDSIRFLMGEVRSLTTELARVGNDLHWQGTLHTESGLAGYAITANTHSDYAEGADIYGEHGQLSVRAEFPFYRRASVASVYREAAGTWTTHEFGAVDPYQRQVEAFADAVRFRHPVEPDATDGLRALEIIEAAAASAAADGSRVEL